jgi:hypothetical protein
LCSINLVDGVVFVGAGDLTIAAIIIVAMDQLTVMFRVNNLAKMEIGSPLVLPHGQQVVLGSKEIVLVVILAI